MDAVIFDLDDTLYPERAYAFSGFAMVAAAFEDHLGGAAEAAAWMRQLFDTQDRPRVFNVLLAERGLTDQSASEDLVRRMVDTYRTHTPTIALHPDGDAALTRLRGRYRLGLISDGPSVQQWAKINALDLRNRVDEIILTGELGAAGKPAFWCGKPSPVAFELMAKRLGVEHTRCAYVADNVAKDFVAPHLLGWTTVRIIRPDGIYRDESSPERGKPDHTITTLDNLDPILEQIGNHG